MARSATRTSATTSAITRTKSTKGELLTLKELLEELQVPMSTFYDWRKKGTAPSCIKLPNGSLRFRRSVIDAWLAQREEVFA